MPTQCELADEQISVYSTCPYDCKYCYAKLPGLEWNFKPTPIKDADFFYYNQKEKKKILVSFSTDPYPPQEWSAKRTQKVLSTLITTKHIPMILTKSDIVKRDLDMLSYRPAWVGMSITSTKKVDDEPLAPSNVDRLDALETAYAKGCVTWISIDPALPDITNYKDIIDATHDYVDYYVLGKLEYATQLGYEEKPPEYWAELVKEGVEAAQSYEKDYYVKKSLGDLHEIYAPLVA